jgi:DMSO reductase family type II enzyme heme b subunit
VDDGYRPEARVSLVQGGDSLFVRLRWTDATDSDPRPPARYPDAGEAHIYKEHSRDIQRFADAACVMVPVEQGPTGSFPAIMMGDRKDPVTLYYWNRFRGFEVLGGAGRGTVEGAGRPFPGTMRRNRDAWEVIFELPAPAPGTPMAFAIWDGDRDQRSGLKFYSMWYEVSP